ncbi:hypothetical protein BGL_2c27520 [Burkholderia plantarii]|uniref:Uncharacterized protein n=1 Tax=Burkholderia plantarii TaxID=41899 RepID=A0A0B6SF09_BURPL|nr:hypothetical protein BGL_2c27520 [Burkholderia plantarii]
MSCRETARQGRSEALFPACAVFLSGTARDRHRPVTQLPGRQGWHPGARHRQAGVREGRCPRERPRREQPSADPQTRATHAGISRPEARSGFPHEFRADPQPRRAFAPAGSRAREGDATVQIGGSNRRFNCSDSPRCMSGCPTMSWAAAIIEM